MRSSQPHRRTPAITYLKITAALVAAVNLIVAGFMISADHARTLDKAHAAIASLNTVLAEQTAGAVQNVELVVDDVARAITEEGIADPDELRRRVADRAFHDMLRARIAGVPQLDAITVIADDGTLLNFSRAWPIPPVNVADRDYFQALRAQPEGRHFISAPVRNRGTGTWTVYLARRLGGPHGQFLGLVLGAVELGYFERFYDSIHPSSGTSIRLWRQDGQLLAAYPPGPTIGDRFDRQVRFDIAPGEQTMVRSTNTVDAADRVIATTRLRRFDLVVSVSRLTRDVLAPWRTDALVIGVGAAFRMAVILVVMALLIRRFADYDAMSAALRARAEAERGQQQAEAALGEAQRLESVGRLTAGIAHDFNNLLSAVLANAELLRRKLGADPPAAAHVENICKVVDRGVVLTRQLLAFSRQQELSPRALALAPLLSGFLSLLQTAVSGRVVVRLDPAPADLWPALADPGQVEQAVLNLVVNARDAMPAGGEVTISFANRQLDTAAAAGTIPPGDYVAVTVADRGTGMTPEVQRRAFEPFFTTKGTSGTGLGLSQVIGFARQSGGDVRINSVPGAGTRVELLLPRAPGDTAGPGRSAGDGASDDRCRPGPAVLAGPATQG